MKKLFMSVALFACAFMFMPTVNAATIPNTETIDYSTDGTKLGTLFFANGTPVTIEARTDDQEGALIKWTEDGEEKSLAVSPYSTVFGGSHNKTTRIEETSITMNGGKLRNVFGGGLHISEVGTANVTINGGTIVDSVAGGGASTFPKFACGCAHFAGDPTNATTVVDSAYVTVNDGTGLAIYGGGEGISYTGDTSVIVNGGTWTYAISGGSNGHTGSSYLEINDGTITTVQSVNRGSMDYSDITVYGGTITNAYVRGDSSDDTVTGAIEESYMYIWGGKVTNVSIGTNGGKVTEVAEDEAAYLEYNEEFVENVDTDEFPEDALVTLVSFTLIYGDEEPTTTQLEKGTILFADEDEYNEYVEYLNETLASLEEDEEYSEYAKYEFGGFYSDEELTEELDLVNVALDEDTTAYIKLVEKEAEVLPPKTGDNIMLYAVLGLITLCGFGFAVSRVKKQFN